MSYLRRLELEADHLGMILSAKSCYDIRQATTLWSLIDSRTISNVFRLFAHHPTLLARENFARAKMPSLLFLRSNSDCHPLGAFINTHYKPLQLSSGTKVWYVFMGK